MVDITELEKIPPQNLEAEKSLIGSILLDKDAMIKIADMVDIEDFYKRAHSDIFETMVELYNKNEPIDVLTMSNRLEEKGLLEKSKYTNGIKNDKIVCSGIKTLKAKKRITDVQQLSTRKTFLEINSGF